jgi:hypothetical protein
MQAIARKTFRNLFCERFGCSEEAFESAVFSRCLYPHARPMADLLRRWAPGYFRDDLEMLRQLGSVGSSAELNWELSNYFYQKRADQGFLRRVGRVRLSRRRLRRLGAEILDN